MKSSLLSLRCLFLLAVAAGLAAPAAAHFPWLAVDDEGYGVYFFGEHIADRTYHMPEKIAKAKVVHTDKDGKQHAVELASVESDKFLGNRTVGKAPAAGVLDSRAEYGIYAGTKLTYYTRHLLGDAPSWPTKPAADVDLQGLVKKEDDGIAVRVLWKGKPLTKAKVQLYCDEGHEEGTAQTNPDGIVRFTNQQVEEGLNGLMVGFVDKEKAGTLDGKEYKSESHYLTVTFTDRR